METEGKESSDKHVISSNAFNSINSFQIFKLTASLERDVCLPNNRPKNPVVSL